MIAMSGMTVGVVRVVSTVGVVTTWSTRAKLRSAIAGRRKG